MHLSRWTLLCFQTLLVYHEVSGANILFFHLMGTSSHRTSIWPLAEKLADKGHNVTYIFPVVNRIGSHPKIKEIIPSKPVPILTEFVSDFDINIRLNDAVFNWTAQIFDKAVELCEAFYESPEVKEWLATPDLKFDLVLIDSTLGECGYGLVYKFKAKHILFSPILPMFLYDAFGIVPESASVPDIFFHKKPQNMGFMDRVISTLSYFIWRLGDIDWFWKVGPLIKQKMNFSDMPDIVEFERNTSLVFVNNYFVEDYPLSLPPMFVSYSGLWCNKNKRIGRPLPKDLESFINETDAFIYVSFGSAITTHKMPENLRNIFFKAFESFPNIRFIWRWGGDKPEGVPKNVLLHRWLPQLDLLAHPKIKGFIMQGGRPSSQEALCFSVPMITFPFFGDQDYNADRMGLIGGAINLDINTITEKELKESVHQILFNSTYEVRMKELSRMFMDRPDPLENVVHWTEFSLRHDTSLLKPLGMNYTWYQRRLLDVYAFFFAVIFGTLGILVFVIVRVLKFCLRSATASKVKTH